MQLSQNVLLNFTNKIIRTKTAVIYNRLKQGRTHSLIRMLFFRSLWKLRFCTFRTFRLLRHCTGWSWRRNALLKGLLRVLKTFFNSAFWAQVVLEVGLVCLRHEGSGSGVVFVEFVEFHPVEVVLRPLVLFTHFLVCLTPVLLPKFFPAKTNQVSTKNNNGDNGVT